MKYLKPYVDDFLTDNYGTAVGIINPDKKFVLKYTTVSGVSGFDGSVKKTEPPVRKSID